MTEGQPFLYHVFTALLGAEGALGFPTLALLLYLHFLPLVTWLPLVAEYYSCQDVSVQPALSFGTAACLCPSCPLFLPFPPLISSRNYTYHIGRKQWLTSAVGYRLGCLGRISRSTRSKKGSPASHLSKTLYIEHNLSLENFLLLTLHTDSDKTKCSDAWRGRWVCSPVILFHVFCLSFPIFCKDFLPAEVANVTLTPSHSPPLYFAQCLLPTYLAL